MKVHSLFLRNFRNIENAQVSFSEGINIISGRNAQGKTNLLEAVFMLSTGKSFRTRFDKEIITFEKPSAEIKAQINAADRDQTVEIILKKSVKRKITKNAVTLTAAQLSDALKCVLFCPDDLSIIKDGAASRRKLLDVAICQLRPGYAKLIAEYSKAYENKLNLLKYHPENEAMMSMLDDFSLVMCRLSAQIIRYRASFANRLSDAAAPIHAQFSGSGERLRIEYKTVSSITDATAPASAMLGQLLEHYHSHKQAEIFSASCLSGCHKDDLDIFINDQSARQFASQGQTRTGALSIKLAEREIFLEESGEYPVLLLDDVLSELDSARQEFVLNRIGGGQTFITCCEDEQIKDKTGGNVIFVEKGQVFQGE